MFLQLENAQEVHFNPADFKGLQRPSDSISTVQPPFVPIIAVMGGVGSGKSSIIRYVASQISAVVIDADQIGHHVLTRPDIHTVLRREFGNQIFDDRGAIDRRALGKLVFGDDPQTSMRKKQLEKIVHPLIKREIQAQIAAARQPMPAGKLPEVILLDAAVILEAGWRSICDSLVFLDTPTELRRQRVQQQRGWSDENWRMREASQFSLEKKRELADFIVDNSTTLEEAGLQLQQIIRQVRESAGRHM
ncbi:MAG: dephospho-CoA kinase [Planctomycetaceae bacterium]